MKILLTSDNEIKVNEVLTAFAQGEVDRALGRFEDRLTRVEIHLKDMNGPKGGPLADKRCVIEAHPAGWHPLTASDDAESVTESITGAVNKMKREMESAFGSAADKR